MRLITTFVVTVFLAGCITPEQRAANSIAKFGPYCERLGYTPETDPWRQCILQARSDFLRFP